MKEYPELDCVALNAGVQRQYDLSRPAEVDMDSFHREVNTNFTSVVNVAMAFLPYLLAKEKPTALLFTGTNLNLFREVAGGRKKLYGDMSRLMMSHFGL